MQTALFSQTTIIESNFKDTLTLEEGRFIIEPFDDSGRIHLNQIIEIPLPKDSLYRKAYQWTQFNYLNGGADKNKASFIVDEFNRNYIIAKSSFIVRYGPPRPDKLLLVYTLKISFKDQKIRVEFSDFYLIKEEIVVHSFNQTFYTKSVINPLEFKKYQLEKFYKDKGLRKPKELIFKEFHQNIVFLKNSLITFITQSAKSEDW